MGWLYRRSHLFWVVRKALLVQTPDITNNIILSPLQLSGVLRALNENNMVNQKSNPVVITEDNEKASISLIDRVPIITTTTNQGTSTSSVSEEVRYTIDASDSTDPETTREIGVTISSHAESVARWNHQDAYAPEKCPDYRKYQEVHQAMFTRVLVRRRSSLLPEFLTDIR